MACVGLGEPGECSGCTSADQSVINCSAVELRMGHGGHAWVKRVGDAVQGLAEIGPVVQKVCHCCCAKAEVQKGPSNVLTAMLAIR